MPCIKRGEAPRQIDHGAHIVFVTSYSKFAVEDFAQGALVYLVKPVDAACLEDTALRVRDRTSPAPRRRNCPACLGVLLQQVSIEHQD